MKPTKAYILKTKDPRSVEYAKASSDSCNQVGLPWEYIEWFTSENHQESWNHTGVPKPKSVPSNQAAQCCFSGHIHIWKKILDSGEPAVILEHDGIMLHKIELDIPDNVIVTLGYKLKAPTKYDHKMAGPPIEIVDVKNSGHEGSHAYAITPRTAEKLLGEIHRDGCKYPIDNMYFLRSRKTNIPIRIMSPTPAIGWVRESTIQKAVAERNYEFIESFSNFLFE